MSDAVRKAQSASAEIARKVVRGDTASARDSESRKGATLDPVANGLDDVTCEPCACEPDIPQNPDRYQNEGIWPG